MPAESARRLVKLRASALVFAALICGMPTQLLAQPSFLDRLHSDLQLSASQDDSWKAFAQAYQPDPQEMARTRDARAKMPGLTSPERMDQVIGMAEDNLAGLRRRGDALKAFYAGLSPQQQKIFDQDTLAPPG